MKFTFALEPLLVQRRAIERQKMEAVAALLAQTENLTARIEELERDLASKVQTVADSGSMPVAEIESAMARLKKELAYVMPDLETARKSLGAAISDRKAVELLKDRKFSEYCALRAREEERELDEANRA